MSSYRKSYQTTTSSAKSRRRGRKTYNVNSYAFRNDEFTANGYFREVEGCEGLVYKRPRSLGYNDYEEEYGCCTSDGDYYGDFDVQDEVAEYINGRYEQCLNINQSEIDLYAKFGKKVSCLVPVLLEESSNECVVMRQADTSLEEDFEHTIHKICSDRLRNRKNLRRVKHYKEFNLIKAKARKAVAKHSGTRATYRDHSLHKANGIASELTRHYYMAKRLGLDADKLVDDVLFIYARTGFNVLSDGHAANVGVYRNNYCVIDYANNRA